MKVKGKEIKILYVIFKHKETERNRQDQKDIERKIRNRQDYISDIENYCTIIIKKFIYQRGKRKVVVRHFVQDDKMTDNRCRKL